MKQLKTIMKKLEVGVQTDGKIINTIAWQKCGFSVNYGDGFAVNISVHNSQTTLNIFNDFNMFYK